MAAVSVQYPKPSDTDFTNADAGFIKAKVPCQVYSDVPGKEDVLVWDNDAYSFINEACPETANESLWRQSQLCYKQGLYWVVEEAIYQVRGLDISNITFVETINSNGVIVIDPLCSYEVAKDALHMYQTKRPGKKIVAIIHTHSHVDHFGGVGAVLDNRLTIPDCPIYAPSGYLEHAVAENVYAGNAMARRAVYMYGDSLEKSEKGSIGTGLGMCTSTGIVGLVAPTEGGTISETGTLASPSLIDDVEIVWQITPGTEAPSEMNFYFPQYNALCMSENATHTLHNIQTLRGALVRDARVWSRYMDESITLFGKDATVAFASHHWPTFGNAEIVEFLSNQRDLYAYMHNETLRQLNAGLNGLEIAEDFKLPDSLDKLWYSRGYYGSLSHNVKAIYNRYMGWFDGNPAHLWEHPPVATAQRYIECIGGTEGDAIEKVIDLGVQYATKPTPDLRFASTLLSHCVFADQTNTRARNELASVFTKLGFGAENATWRNFYLTGAKELTGQIAAAPIALSAESLLALDLEQLFDTLAIVINGPEASEAVFTIDFQVEDIKTGWHLNMGNSVLTHHGITFQERNTPPDSATTLTVWTSHQELVNLVDGASKDLSNTIKVGDETVWTTLTSLLTTYNTGFAIVTPEEDPKPA